MDEPVDPARSRLMARIGRRDTKPELIVRRMLHAMGCRFRLQRRDLPGTPDIVLPSRRIALFVHGCYWHRHDGCRRASVPKTRTMFWTDKFDRNVARDRRVEGDLRDLGWRPVVVWECETRDRDRLAGRLREEVVAAHKDAGR